MNNVDEVALMRRDLFDRVMRAVRALGAASSLDDALQRVTDHVVGLLGFGSAALNVLDGDALVTRAVTGPAEAGVLFGQRALCEEWEALLAEGHADGGLVFVDHRAVLSPQAQRVGSWWEPGGESDLPEGVWHSGDTLLAPTRDETGALVAVLSADLAVGTVQDTDQRTALALFAAEAGSALLEWEARAAEEERRRTAEQRLRIVWRSGLVAAAVLDERGVVLDVNERGAQMLGYTVEELVGVPLREMVPELNLAAASDRFRDLMDTMGAWVQERELRHRDGRTVWTSMHAAATLEGNPRRPVLVVQWVDITARRDHAARLAHELDFDAVTGLPNRRSLERRLADLFERSVPFGVLELDLDGFRSVLDGLGHEAADRLLQQVGRRLDAVRPPEALLCRDSGDEFVLVAEGENDLDELAALADTLTAALREPFDIDGVSLTVQASVGVSSSREFEHQHPVDALREADEALGRAKRRGRSRVEVYDPGFDAPLSRTDFELELDLRLALQSAEELEPHFQSVISLTTGAVVGYESLLRWRHPRLGVLLPSRFIPVAERSGLAGALGNRMMELMSGRVAPDTNASVRPWISVNVSAAQLGRGTLLDAITRLVDTTFPGAPSALQLEITETSLLDASPAVIDELFAAVELGARLALDDFGTGYSSLTLLRDLPVTSIKIDRSFIAPIAVDVRARTIVQHTIELCQGLGMSTVAEGIETHEQLAWLQTLGCDHGQGFLIDRPAPWPRPPA